MAMLKDYDVCEIVTDDTSGKSMNRKGLQHVISLVESGKVKAVIVTKGGGPLVHGPTNINPLVGRPWSALQALNVVIGLFSSLAVNMPDFARFSKSSKASASQTLLLPLIGTLGALGPIFVTSAYKEIWGG